MSSEEKKIIIKIIKNITTSRSVYLFRRQTKAESKESKKKWKRKI